MLTCLLKFYIESAQFLACVHVNKLTQAVKFYQNRQCNFDFKITGYKNVTFCLHMHVTIQGKLGCLNCQRS